MDFKFGDKARLGNRKVLVMSCPFKNFEEKGKTQVIVYTDNDWCGIKFIENFTETVDVSKLEKGWKDEK